MHLTPPTRPRLPRGGFVARPRRARLVTHTFTFPHRPSRQVQPKEAEKLAEELDAAHIETSAKQNINVCTYFSRFYSASLLCITASELHPVH